MFSNPFAIGAIVLAVWAYLRGNGGVQSAFPYLNFGNTTKGTSPAVAPTVTTSATPANPGNPQNQPSTSGSGLPNYSPQTQAQWNPVAPQYGRFYNPQQFQVPSRIPTLPAPAQCGCGCGQPSNGSCSTCKTAGRGNCATVNSGVANGPRGNAPVTVNGAMVTIQSLQQQGIGTPLQAWQIQQAQLASDLGDVPANPILNGYYQPQ